MVTIYRGAKWQITIDSDTALNTDMCRLYNPATHTYVTFSTTLNSTTNGVKHYTCILTADDTKGMSVGTYHLECFSMTDEMAYHQDSYARVVNSSNSD